MDSVKKFIDRKMNNKFDCFDDMQNYLFFYDINDNHFCVTKMDKQSNQGDYNNFSDSYENIKRKIYYKDINVVDNLYNKIRNNELNSFHASFRIIDESNLTKWYDCEGKIINNRNIILGTLFEKDLARLKDKINIENIFESIELNNRGFVLLLKVDQYDEVHFTTYYKYGDFVKNSIKKCIIFSLKKKQKIFELDEWSFLIFSPDGDSKKAKELYQDITNSINKLLSENKQKIYFSILAGAIELNKEFYSYDKVIECLNFSLNSVEGFNGNKFHMFDMHHYIKLKRKEDVLRNMYWAVNHNFEGFELFYQPIIDINTKTVTALEALLRFKEKDADQYIQPSEFLPLLEQTNLMLPVGKWILKTAMVNCKELQHIIPGLKINVNLSYIQVNQNNSAKIILDLLEETKLDATLLGIEITETGNLNTNQYHNFCLNLGNEKIAIILDDYGSGFSNAHRLAMTKPKYIKIDYSFTKQAIKSEYYQKILKNIIAMAHDLQLLVCVEGVENHSEYEIIKSLNADYMQGYMFAKPMPKQNFINDYKKITKKVLNC